MLSDKPSSAIVGVRDLGRARKFYEEVLGLSVVDEAMGEVLTFRTGDTALIVYRSDQAGTNKANAVAWSVGDDLEAITADLTKKGVTFEHYDMPDTTYSNGVHTTGDFRMAWFKDPDGNFLHLHSGA